MLQFLYKATPDEIYELPHPFPASTGLAHGIRARTVLGILEFIGY